MAVLEQVACATCELHAEAIFRVEGMDCNEEVVILERRLKPLAGMEAISADVIGQRLHVGDENIGFVVVLQLHTIREAADIMAEMQFSGGAIARENTFFKGFLG